MKTAANLQLAVEQLERFNIKLHPQKYAVLELLYESKERPSVEELRRKLAPRFPRVNATSIRNTVNVFNKLGLLPQARERDNGKRHSQAG